ncbi:MAG TPA: dienelactone hydrolase family protein [Chitinophagales bacterium]|nr:dienelactone hydrolase family protein [Chitinophagales bacterium]
MAIKEETITYTADTVTMNGFVAYNENDTTKRPVVLIVHEWWGQTDYVKNRARQLAALGYLAMAVDIYGNSKTAETPEQAKALAMPFYQNPQMAKQRFDAAMDKIKTYPAADTNNIAAIGYCFGGGLLLNVARLGENIKGVVSFHGSLLGTPADKNLLKAEILVCHGEADKFVPETEVTAFKKQMDSIGAHYTFKSYADATHAFTNPDATENGKKFSMPIAYNAAADTASFKDMQDFFGRIFK